MTDNEIIKALECCITTQCKGCCYRCEHVNQCTLSLKTDALDLINRQKAEIERLEKTIEGYAELEQGCYVTGYKNIRVKAIKEFAERLKCGVPQETGVIRCADIDSLVKEMVGEGK